MPCRNLRPICVQDKSIEGCGCAHGCQAAKHQGRSHRAAAHPASGRRLGRRSGINCAVPVVQSPHGCVPGRHRAPRPDHKAQPTTVASRKEHGAVSEPAGAAPRVSGWHGRRRRGGRGRRARWCFGCTATECRPDAAADFTHSGGRVEGPEAANCGAVTEAANYGACALPASRFQQADTWVWNVSLFYGGWPHEHAHEEERGDLR